MSSQLPRDVYKRQEWGGTFEMNSGRTILTDAEYEEMAEAIRQALKEQG